MNRRPVMLVSGVAIVGGIFFLVTSLNSPTRAKQCRDAAFEHDEAARVDPKIRQYPHHAYFFEACRDGCDQEKDAQSCVSTAVVYREGKGLTYEGDVDFAKAAEYARKACDIRQESSCPSEEKYLCLQDPSACASRCESGNGRDCATLASIVDGFGTDAYDGARAARLHRAACDAGHSESCEKWPKLLCASQPTECSDKCKAGDAALCFQLGFNLSRGIGEVTKNEAKGLEFKKRGCELDAKVDPECGKVLNDAKVGL